MKRFLIAFGVFNCWFILGIVLMNNTGALDRGSIFASKVLIEEVVERTPDNDVSKPELIPFVDEQSSNSEINGTQKEPDTFIGNNVGGGNQQLVQDLTKSIQDKKRAIAEETEQLRNVKKKTSYKALAPRTFDALFYPEFKHARFVAEQKATSFLSFIKQKLSADPNLHIKVVGHTDYIGDKDDNYALALDEAKKVREFLIKSLKLPDNQVSAYSNGETEPIYDRDSENRELNHRIEIYFE